LRWAFFVVIVEEREIEDGGVLIGLDHDRNVADVRQ